MKTIFTVILFFISVPLFSQNQGIDCNQQNRIKANESVPYKEYADRISKLRSNSEADKKEEKINLQQRIIKQKDQFIVFSVILGSVFFAALVVIFILYRIRNQAYKQVGLSKSEK